MKRLKGIFSALLACILLTAFSVQVSAGQEEGSQIMPRYVNAIGHEARFWIANDQANVNVLYYGKSTAFTRAEVTVKVQKRFLLVIWNDVGEWSASSTDLNGSFYKTFAAKGTGYYRALITLTIYGNAGAVDTIEMTREYEYN